MTYDPGLSPEALTAIGEMQKRMVEPPMGISRQQKVEHTVRTLTDQERAESIDQILEGPDRERADSLEPHGCPVTDTPE